MQGRIGLLGARGYLGCTLVPRLMAAGYRVSGVGRKLPPAWPAATFFHMCDATDAAALNRAIHECDGVINAAAGSPGTMLRIAANLAACRKQGWQGRLVNISSMSVYGQSDGVLDEIAIPVPASGHGYGRAKLAAEKLLHAGPRADRTISLRPGCLYGVAAPVWVDRMCALLLSGRLGWLWDEGAGVCPLMHVDDMASIIIEALRTDVAGVHNLPCPETITWNMYIRRLATGLGMNALPRVSSVRLDVETYLNGPLRHAAARFGVHDAGPITPAMRRLFRSRARIVSVRTPLLPATLYTPLQAGIAQAVTDFRRRVPRPLHSAPFPRAHAQTAS